MSDEPIDLINDLRQEDGYSTLPRTDHGADIARLRWEIENGIAMNRSHPATIQALAADLLELHDDTGISLDRWDSARRLVEDLIGHPITENEV